MFNPITRENKINPKFINIFFKCNELVKNNILLLTVLFFFNASILTIFNNYPVRPDEIWYLENLMYPAENKKLFFRFYHFYFGKLLSFLFNNPLIAAKYCSIFFTNLIIIFSYKISMLNTNSKFISGLCALVVSTYPYLLILSSNFSTDITATCFAIIYIYIINKIILKKNANLDYIILGILFIFGVFSKQSNIVLVAPTLLLMYFIKNEFNIKFYLLGIFAGLAFLSTLNFMFLDNFFYHINPKNYLDFLLRFKGQLSNDILQNIRRTASYTIRVFSEIPWLIYLIVPICFGYLNIKSTNIKKNILIIISLTAACILLFESMHISYAGLKLHPRYLIIFNVPIIIVFFIIYSEEISKLNISLSTSVAFVLFSFFLLFLLSLNTKIFINAREFFLLISIFVVPVLLGLLMNNKLNYAILISLFLVIILNNLSLALGQFKITNDFNYEYTETRNLLKKCKNTEINIEIDYNRINKGLIIFLHADKIIDANQYALLKKQIIKKNKIVLLNQTTTQKKIVTCHLNLQKKLNLKKFQNFTIFSSIIKLIFIALRDGNLNIIFSFNKI